MTTLADIEARLSGAIDADGALALKPDVGAGFDTVLGSLALPNLLLSGATVATRQSKGTLAKVSAAGTADLLNIAGASVEIVITGADADTVTLKVTLPSAWHFSKSFPGLPPSFKEDSRHPGMPSLQPSLLYDLELSNARLVVRNKKWGRWEQGINFVADCELEPSYGRLAGLLGLDGPVQLKGTIELADHEPTKADLQFNSPAAELSVAGLALTDVSLHVRTTGDAPDTITLTSLEIDGTVAVGKTDPVTMRVTSRYDLDAGVFDFAGVATGRKITIARGVAAVAELAGGSAADFQLPKAIDLSSFHLQELDAEIDTVAPAVRRIGVSVGSDQTWKVVPGKLEIGELGLHWQVLYPFSDTRTMGASVSGTLAFGQSPAIHFDVAAAKSDGFTIEGRLRAGESIDLAALVQHALGFEAKLPELQVDQLEVSATSTGDFELAGSVASDWAVEINHRTFTLEAVSFSLQKAGTDEQAVVRAETEIAGSRLYVQATVTADDDGAAGVDFKGGTLPTGQPISLTGVVEYLAELVGVSLPAAVPDVTLSGLEIEFNTATKEFDLKGTTDTEIVVPFISGDAAKIHAEVQLTSTVDAATGKRSLAGDMEGDLVIGSSTFRLRYEMGKDTHVFSGSWASTSSTDLLGIDTVLDAMGIGHDVHVPTGLDLQLKQAYLEYQAERHTLTLVANSARYGTAFLVASKLPLGTAGDEAGETTSGTWQFVFGIEYSGAAKLSQVPVLGDELDAADIFTFEELGILVSSATFKDFTIPQLPPLGESQPEPVAAGTSLPLGEGISFVGVVALDEGDQSPSMQALRTVIPQTRLTITAAYLADQEELTLRGVLDGSLDIPTGGSSPLTIGNAGVEFIVADGVTFEIFGELAMHFDDETLHVTPRLAISAEEIEFMIKLEFEKGWAEPMGIPGLTLDEVGFEMGINLLPAPGVNVGLQGKAHIEDDPRGSDAFAFVLEVVEEVPNPLLLSFALDHIDVERVLKVFAPDVDATSLPGFVTDIKATQVSFFWADSVVTLPDGTVAQPGLRFGGNVEILGLRAHAELEIDQVVGVRGALELAPIHVGHVLDVTGHGKGVYVSQRNGEPALHRAVPDKSLPLPQRVEVVPPGGPAIEFRTNQSPYLFVTVIVTLFDFAHEEVEALVTDDGIVFKLVYEIAHAVHAELDVTLHEDQFHLYSQFGLHLKADIGPIEILGVDFGTIHLDAGFDLELEIDVGPTNSGLELTGDFEFEGARLTFPPLRLPLPASLSDIPQLLLAHIEDEAEEIFKDLFDAALRLFEDAGKEIAHLAEEAAAEIEEVGKAALAEAGKVVAEAEEAVKHAIDDVERAAEKLKDEAVAIEQAAEAEVTKIATAAAAEVEKIGKEIAHVAAEAAHEIEAIATEIAHEAAAVVQAVERFAAEAAHEVEQIVKAVAKEVEHILAEAEKVAKQVLAAAEAVANAIAHEAEQIWNEAKNLARKAAEAVAAAAHAVAHAAKSVWHAVSSY